MQGYNKENKNFESNEEKLKLKNNKNNEKHKNFDKFKENSLNGIKAENFMSINEKNQEISSSSKKL